MKKSILIAGAAILALSIPAIAAHHEGGHMMKPDMTRADVEARIKAHFAEVDANKDGAITREEIDAGRDARQAGRMDEHFKKMDANGDGSISRAEFDAAHAARQDEMKAAMADGERGRPMMRDGEGGHHGMKMKFGGRMFDKADANKDGKVTLAEATSTALSHFDKADADKNGTVTSQERMDYWKVKKEEWKDKKDAAS